MEHISNKPPTVVLISLDTLRADVAYSKKFPSITRLMSEGTSFRNTISSSPITPISHATVLTGLQPFNHGIRHLFRESLRKDVVTLAEVFGRMGYRTGAVVAAPGLHSWYGFNRGFESYDDDLPRLPDGTDPLLTVDVKTRGAAKRRGEIVVARALRWLDSIGKAPCFQFVHFFDSHWPYEPPGQFAAAGGNSYEGEVAYMDHYLGVYLDGLSSHERLDNSLIVCFSDHGEDLGGLYTNDHAGVSLGHPEESGHGCLLYDATQMVPLIFRMPSRVPSGVSVNAQVRLVDIMPTVCDLVGAARAEKLDGRSLSSAFSEQTIESRVAYSETFFPREQYEASGIFPTARNLKAVRIDNRYKVIWESEGEGMEVYDLLEDPNEERPEGNRRLDAN